MTPPSVRALNRISNPSTVACWNSAIRASVRDGLPREAVLVYRRMKQNGVRPNNLTFPFLLKAYAGLPHAPAPAVAHAHVAKSPFCDDIFVGAALVDLYVKSREVDVALKVLDGMPQRDVVAWNTVIVGVSQLGSSLQRALFLFRRMRLEDIAPDLVTYISLARSCGCEEKLSFLRAVHSLAIAQGFEADASVANTLIAAYCKCEDLSSSESVFSEIAAGMRSVVSYNSMIAGYARLCRSKEAILLFSVMARDGIRPDLSTILSLLSLFANSGSLLEGELVHSLGIKLGVDCDISVMNTLISLHSKCGDLEAALYCFNNMPKKTCVSWTALISGYVQRGDINEAMALFSSMEAAGEKPDALTIVALLSACSQVGGLDLGKHMHDYVLTNGFKDDILVSNALIDMYAKCGSIGEARRLFDRMSRRTIVSWTTMVLGYAINGEFEQALDLFSHMVEQGLKPNRVTFLAVLQACVHGGLLEKGWDYFNLMSEVYGIAPRLEHYACVIDLLGRRGRVSEALDFIRRMPLEPDAGVWGSLLGASVTHREIEIGEYAASRLFSLGPQTGVSYVGMANIYAAKERWEGVAEVRTMMRQKKARKNAGQSAIEIDGLFHAFAVDDRSHPQSSQIYEVLDTLFLQLKKKQM
ncbi:Pentatricopeptide repeat-containing protein, mitochondrial [Ananas comosus]|uniref:Pentatricopeptide repeat-containing protein, mitochondrial n=1 Tax=Ananas comosus TaxID=4615 RepID=A0A199VMP6_ANACO|nr:Pentatricopeptide repeat-containing protein, mitochondrial [Ananas comosus]